MPDEEDDGSAQDDGHAPGAADDDAGPDDGDDEEWRFSVDEVGEDGADEAEEAEGSIFGPPPEVDASVDPGDPKPENVLFVALGVVVSIALLAAVVGLI